MIITMTEILRDLRGIVARLTNDRHPDRKIICTNTNIQNRTHPSALKSPLLDIDLPNVRHSVMFCAL